MINLSDDLLQSVIALAKEAGEAILQVYNTDFEVTKNPTLHH